VISACRIFFKKKKASWNQEVRCWAGPKRKREKKRRDGDRLGLGNEKQNVGPSLRKRKKGEGKRGNWSGAAKRAWASARERQKDEED